MKPIIVIDKSYLRGAAGNKIRSLCDSSRALMPEDLLFELLTGDFETRTKCFGKLPREDNPMELLPNVGTLLRYEMENRRSCSPIWEHRIKMTYKFNPALATGEFQLTEEQAAGVAEWERRVAEDIKSLVERGNIADRVFPQLKGLQPGQDSDLVAKIVGSVAADMEVMREIYDTYSPSNFPPSADVDQSWIVFRWFQVHMIGVVEYFDKYGPGLNVISQKKLENEVSDLNYLLVSVLAGRLATRDGIMARRFKLLRPDGEIHS